MYGSQSESFVKIFPRFGRCRAETRVISSSPLHFSLVPISLLLRRSFSHTSSFSISVDLQRNSDVWSFREFRRPVFFDSSAAASSELDGTKQILSRTKARFVRLGDASFRRRYHRSISSFMGRSDMEIRTIPIISSLPTSSRSITAATKAVSAVHWIGNWCSEFQIGFGSFILVSVAANTVWSLPLWAVFSSNMRTQ